MPSSPASTPNLSSSVAKVPPISKLSPPSTMIVGSPPPLSNARSSMPYLQRVAQPPLSPPRSSALGRLHALSGALRPKVFLSQALSSGDNLFDKLARHKNSALRNYHIALRDLERLKKEEHKQELAATSPEPVAANSAPIGPQPVHPIDPPPTSTPIGFFRKFPSRRPVWGQVLAAFSSPWAVGIRPGGFVPSKAASKASHLPPAPGPQPPAPVSATGPSTVPAPARVTAGVQPQENQN